MTKNVKLPLPVMGVDTLSDETALTKGAVRAATNVNIDRAGRPSMRRGIVRAVAETGFHSVWTAAQKGWTLVAQNAVLNRLDPTTLARTPLYTLQSNYPVEYTEYNGNLYFSNRHTIGWVPSNSTTARPVGVPTPGAPFLEVSASGGLRAGQYAVAISICDDRGEESGLSSVRTITLPQNGGIRLTGLPTGVEQVFIYVTPPDGDQLLLTAEIPGVYATYVIGEGNPDGAQADTEYLQPMPPGDFIRSFNGRLFTATDGVMRFSQALRPHLHSPRHGVIPLSGRTAFMEPVIDGMYVGDSRGVWFFGGGDPSKWEAKLVSTCRAVARSSIKVPPEHFPNKLVSANEPVALWLSTSGYVVGMPGGNVVELQPDRVKVPPGLSGRSTFLFRNGMKQVVTPVNSTSTAAVGTAVDSVIS